MEEGGKMKKIDWQTLFFFMLFLLVIAIGMYATYIEWDNKIKLNTYLNNEVQK